MRNKAKLSQCGLSSPFLVTSAFFTEANALNLIVTIATRTAHTLLGATASIYEGTVMGLLLCSADQIFKAGIFSVAYRLYSLLCLPMNGEDLVFPPLAVWPPDPNSARCPPKPMVSGPITGNENHHRGERFPALYHWGHANNISFTSAKNPRPSLQISQVAICRMLYSMLASRGISVPETIRIGSLWMERDLKNIDWKCLPANVLRDLVDVAVRVHFINYKTPLESVPKPLIERVNCLFLRFLVGSPISE